MSRNLGYIGLGVMGLPFARHLAAAGHRVAVHDVDAAAVRRAVSFDNIAAAVKRSSARWCAVFARLGSSSLM